MWLIVLGVQDRPTHEASVVGEDWEQVVWSKQREPTAVGPSATGYRAPFGARMCDLLCFGKQINRLLAAEDVLARPQGGIANERTGLSAVVQ